MLERCEQANASEPITIFEIETAAALCLFAQHPADVVLLEVGLGGRLDATNVIDAPLASVIAPISMDHTEFLGETLTAIAREKAGIIKRNVPTICAEQSPEVMAVIEAAGPADEIAAPCRGARMAGQCRARTAGVSGRSRADGSGGAKAVRTPSVRQCGPRDCDTARAQNWFRLGPAAFEAGIVNAEWPARMQRLASGTLLDQAPQGCEIWLDGGHNAEGGRVAAAALGDLEERVSRPLVVIVGMMANKDAARFSPISPG